MKVILLLATMLFTANASANIIEHQGDRVIINVEEMDLTGDESLMDILMSTMPEVMSVDGRTQYSNEFYGNFAIRIDNLEIVLDDKAFLKNTKARELRCIKICMNPGVMKGCNGMKKVIDCYFRKQPDGTTGTVNLEAGTYGNASTYNTVNYQHKNLNIKGWLTGDLSYKKDYGAQNGTHGSRQDAKVQMVWDSSPSDNLEFVFNQKVQRSRTSPEPCSSSQYLYTEFVYTHTFSNDAYGLFDISADYKNSNGINSHERETNPFVILEFSFPLFTKNLWITPGIEFGYTGKTDVIKNVTDRQKYEDYYLQFDYTLKKFHLMVGDRFRILNYWNNNDDFDHTWMNHFYTVSSWVDINDHNVLQGTFAHRFFSPENSTFNVLDEQGQNLIGYDFKNVYKPDAYISELRYTHQQKNLLLTAVLTNLHQQFKRGQRQGEGNDNTLSCGFTTNWKVNDWLRLTAGATYNHERFNNEVKGYILYNNFVNLKLIPEVVTNGWRFLATMLYNSRRSTNETFAYYTMPNFYAALRVSKDLHRHWNLYVDAHDLADQRTGNREVLFGATYKW